MTRPYSEYEHFRDWLAHVQAGRIGPGAQRAQEMMRRHVRLDTVLRPDAVRIGAARALRLSRQPEQPYEPLQARVRAEHDDD